MSRYANNLEFVLDVLSDTLWACSERCSGGCTCSEDLEKAETLVKQWYANEVTE